MELISKEEVLKIIKEETDVLERINDLPMIFLGEEFVCDTVTAWNKGYMAGQNDRPKGKWYQSLWRMPIEKDIRMLFDYKCDLCDKEVTVERIDGYNYCPNCGAEMEE